MKNLNDIPRRLRDLYAARFEPEGARAIVDICWRALLVLAALVAAGALLWGMVGMFGALKILAAAENISSLPPAPLSRSALRQVVQGFDDRAATHQVLSANPSSFTDPSR